ncbi:LytTR family DNA-binding domain-containing protein [Aestuariivivens sp. NBU2969]|uniref:LytTR family DNA-binding domain-containing protein n=1 Tax=Aestuariivivens sp. NBU2969 TaxID=2873267 RepID=UPI001CBBD096|nr:LytTR family DNA-binding domain-containing protein [Aestuariivivens sp. NBU2969]
MTTNRLQFNQLQAHKFARVHQSYLVNLERIDKIEHNHIYINNTLTPIGNRYKTPFLKRLDLG